MLGELLKNVIREHKDMNCAQLKNREGASELDNGTDGDMRLENQ
jgi:hypothetical protein